MNMPLNNKDMCTFCGEREAHTRGLCTRCYNRMRRNGTAQYKHTKIRYCLNCGKEGTYAKGLCRACYARKARRGDLSYTNVMNPPPLCTRCGKKETHIKGLCRKCYYEVKARDKGVKPKKATYTPTTERGKQLNELYKQGFNLREIGEQIGISRQAVSQLLKK